MRAEEQVWFGDLWGVYVLRRSSYASALWNPIADPCKAISGSRGFWAPSHNLFSYVFIKVELIFTYFFSLWDAFRSFLRLLCRLDSYVQRCSVLWDLKQILTIGSAADRTWGFCLSCFWWYLVQLLAEQDHVTTSPAWALQNLTPAVKETEVEVCLESASGGMTGWAEGSAGFGRFNFKHISTFW